MQYCFYVDMRKLAAALEGRLTGVLAAAGWGGGRPPAAVVTLTDTARGAAAPRLCELWGREEEEEEAAADMPACIIDVSPPLRLMLVTLNGDSVEFPAGAGSVACSLPACVRPASTRTMRVGVDDSTGFIAAGVNRLLSGNTAPAGVDGRWLGLASSAVPHPVTRTLPSCCCPSHACAGGSSFRILG